MSKQTPSRPNAGAPTNATSGAIHSGAAGSDAVAAFLEKARAVGPAARAGSGRLVFALDATFSRQPTWDMACALQAEMFQEAAAIGSLEVRLMYYRGLAECCSSGWVSEPAQLTRLMGRIACEGGKTQIGRVLRAVRNEAGNGAIQALVFVGDAMEEALDDLCGAAGELGLLGVPVFVFQEGRDAIAEHAFREIARLSGGAWCPFDPGAAHQLRALLRAAAAYAAGGREALRQLARQTGGGAAHLLEQMKR